MAEWYRVEVSDHYGQIVAIEPEMLTGRDIGDCERIAIRSAIEHLQGFLGCARPEGVLFCAACGPIETPCEHYAKAQDFL